MVQHFAQNGHFGLLFDLKVVIFVHHRQFFQNNLLDPSSKILLKIVILNQSANGAEVQAQIQRITFQTVTTVCPKHARMYYQCTT